MTSEEAKQMGRDAERAGQAAQANGELRKADRYWAEAMVHYDTAEMLKAQGK